MKKSTLALSLVTALSLTACGGGGGGGDSEGSSGSSGFSQDSVESYVLGEFKKISETEEMKNSVSQMEGPQLISSNSGLSLNKMDYYDSDTSFSGCYSGVDKYFESDGDLGVIVFASETVPEEDYKYAATVVESKMNEVLEELGITSDEYKELKGKISPTDVALLVTKITSIIKDYSDGYDENNEEGESLKDYVISGFESDYLDVYEFIYDAQYEIKYGVSVSVDEPKKDEFVTDLIYSAIYSGNSETSSIFEESGLPTIDFNKLLKSSIITSDADDVFTLASNYLVEELRYFTQKVAVCISPKVDMGSWGEGGQVGITFGSNTARGRGDAKTVIKHELVHHLQFTLTYGEKIERWFAEGMAVYTAGQTVAKSLAQGAPNPTGAITNDEAENLYGNDEDYSVYAYAYSTLVEGEGIDSKLVVEFLYDMRKDYKSMTSTDSNYFKPFAISFENTFSDYYDDLYMFKMSEGLNGGFSCSIYSEDTYYNEYKEIDYDRYSSDIFGSCYPEVPQD